MPLEMDSRFKGLVQADEPLQLIWDWMVELGRGTAEVCGTDSYFDEYEKGLNELETFVHQCYFEAYAQLAQASSVQTVLDWLRASPSRIIVFCDGLSVREAVLLERRLDGASLNGRQITAQVAGFRPSPVPSDTYTWQRQLWPAGTGAMKSTEAFEFYQLQPGETLVGLDFSRRTVVRHPLPDALFHQTKPMYGTRLSDAFHRLAEDVERLLALVPPGVIHLSGDHGYLYFPGAAQTWSLPEKYKRLVSKAFNNARHASREALTGLAEEVAESWQWYRLFMPFGEYVLLLGRYWVRRHGDPQACHGGLSLTECMVPVLEIEVG